MSAHLLIYSLLFSELLLRVGLDFEFGLGLELGLEFGLGLGQGWKSMLLKAKTNQYR